MISFRNVTDVVERHGKKIPLILDENFDFDRRRMGLICSDADAPAMIFDLMAGYRIPTEGIVHRFGRVSWPIGRQLQLRSELSGRQTLRFISKIYELDFDECETIANALIDFEHFYNKQVTEWPRVMFAKLALVIALLPDFDIYLVEGDPSLADEAFMGRWRGLFDERLADRQMIMAALYPHHLKRFCRSVVVLKNGKMDLHPSIDAAFAALEA